MKQLLCTILCLLGGLASPLLAQAPAPGPSTLRVTVRDATDLGLPQAVVAITDAQGVAQQAAVDRESVATFTGLQPGAYQVTVTADGFREQVLQVNVRRGNNAATAKMVVAISEQITVAEQGTDERRDNGFTQTLTADEIDALSDDPDEMAEQLAQMAGPGAQIFVDGFRGGRLPPKDQIQQVRFNSNSFSAEYHEAGMVRVEVITRPGMGGWRGRANFGFRDESLNARNAFSPVKEPTEQQRYNLSFQGPIVKGKTGFSMSVDGNNAFDSRTIRAQSPGDQTVTGLARNTTDGLNANFRIDHAIGQGSQVRAEYQRRATDRGNLGVGDFDLPERAYDTEQVNDTFRVRNTRVLGKKVFSELKFEFTSSDSATLPLSALPTVRVNEAFTAGGAGQSGSRSVREIELAQNFDFTIRRKHAMRAGLLFETSWVTSTQQQNGNGTYVFQSIDAYNLGQPDTYTLRVGDPLVEYSQVRAGWFLQDDVRLGRNLSVSVGVRQEIQTQVERCLEPRAAGGIHLDRQPQDDGARWLRHLLRLVRRQPLRADASRRRPAPVRHHRRGSGLPRHLRRRHAAALERHPCRVAGSASHPAGLPRARAAAHVLGRPPHGLHVDAWFQHAAVGQRQRPGGRGAARSGIGQHHRDSVHGAPRERSPHGRRQRAARAPAHLLERDVSAPEHAQLRRLGDQPAVRQHEPGRGLGPVGPGHPSPAVPDVQRANLEGHPRRLQHAGRLGRAVQHHHRAGRQPRHGVQRPPGRHRAEQRTWGQRRERDSAREQGVRIRRPDKRAWRRRADAAPSGRRWWGGRGRRDEPARPWWPGRRRRSANGHHGRRRTRDTGSISTRRSPTSSIT